MATRAAEEETLASWWGSGHMALKTAVPAEAGRTTQAEAKGWAPRLSRG